MVEAYCPTLDELVCIDTFSNMPGFNHYSWFLFCGWDCKAYLSHLIFTPPYSGTLKKCADRTFAYVCMEEIVM
jgi:hypothetical protein